MRSFCIINYFTSIKKLNKLVKPQFLCHYAFVFVGLFFFLAFLIGVFTVIFIWFHYSMHIWCDFRWVFNFSMRYFFLQCAIVDDPSLWIFLDEILKVDVILTHIFFQTVAIWQLSLFQFLWYLFQIRPLCHSIKVTI